MKHTFEEYELALKGIGGIIVDKGDKFTNNYRTISSLQQFNMLEDMLEDLKNAPRTVSIKRVAIFDNRKQ